jgi:hypothetical protein
MTHDMRKNNEIMNDNEQPLELSAELRSEAMALLAPMDRSVASSVTASISMRRSRRRLLQGLWLGLSPVMAVAIVAVLYVGGAVLPRGLSSAAPSRAFISSNPQVGVADTTVPKVASGSEAVAAVTAAPSSRIVLDGNVARRQLLATSLRARHADVAAELDNAAPGQDVFLTLEPDEIRGFASLMALYGYSGEEPSGLRILPRYSADSWSSSLGSSSSLICIIP